jgi:hypothetical protein
MAHPRAGLDFYIEPKWVTDVLLTLPCFSGVYAVYDPCAGSGNVLAAAADAGYSAFGSDLHADRGGDELVDFNSVTDEALAAYAPFGSLAVVSNPPYGRGDVAQQFVTHFLGLNRASLVAAFVQSRFLHSGGRHAFFTAHPPTCLAVLADRPSCPPGDAYLAGEIEAKGGSQDYCWLIYDKRGLDVSTRTVWLRRPTKARAIVA